MRKLILRIRTRGSRRTMLGEDDIGLWVVLGDPLADPLLLLLLQVRGREDTVHDDSLDTQLLDLLALRLDLLLDDLADDLAVDLKAAVDEAAVRADDVAQVSGPVNAGVDIAAEGTTQTDDGDRCETIAILLDYSVDEVLQGASDSDSCAI